MANRNLADEVDALAKGLASLRVANKRIVSRIAALEDRQLSDDERFRLHGLIWPPLKEDPPDIDATRLVYGTRRTIWQRIRLWWKTDQW